MTGRWAAHSDKSDEPPETDVPAVAYVRMSTDHQKYSTENWSAPSELVHRYV
ncbi:hypothetical protein [Aliiruegeria lutimaris]|uniref:Resolvase, N terminal domain n=1 Tax=Aliiruegeria lutimaris TaxID=571298 RepID=A0A1G9QMA9_9RHOB|nr:hypothetical protein [Aliiruegeria lutimaris]SDM12139.1 hypothetical protein SAMN04488026_11831 [Aliiruegeria lutimaris]